MSTLEKAMGLLQEMPERKLDAVYMYMRFVNSQTDDDDVIPSANKDANSIVGIDHEYTNLALSEKEATAEKRQKAFQGLMSFAGTLPEDFDYEHELEEAREAKYARFI